ncbi:hypothetical protein [Streptomyces mirabilis]|uniref:hypothetical protein n=1 Tax=Streptomyces mirabilis TaxID=68239 RepID=UPI003662FCF6
MLTVEARVETARPSRYLVQLRKHFDNTGRHLGHRPRAHNGDGDAGVGCRRGEPAAAPGTRGAASTTAGAGSASGGGVTRRRWAARATAVAAVGVLAVAVRLGLGVVLFAHWRWTGRVAGLVLAVVLMKVIKPLCRPPRQGIQGGVQGRLTPTSAPRDPAAGQGVVEAGCVRPRRR